MAQIPKIEKKHQKIKEIVEKELLCSAHDIDHTMRVYNLCLYLAKDEPNIDLEVLKIAALLHDIARIKEEQDNSGNTDHVILSAEMAEKILKDLSYSREKIEQIKHCILSHRFRKGIKPRIKEAKILFDADKLDIIGVIGIARSFMIAGQYGQKIHSNVPLKEYIKDNLVGRRLDGRIKDVSKHTPNLEFEIKFKYIPNRLYTEKAKKIAKQRIEFMEQFFKKLKKEINGKM